MKGVPSWVQAAAAAAVDKKAVDVVVLDVREDSSFCDFFIVASGTNQKQLVAIVDAVRQTLRAQSLRPSHVEGYPKQEWILMDYGALVVHVFAETTRAFYGLERLWGGATRHEVETNP